MSKGSIGKERNSDALKRHKEKEKEEDDDNNNANKSKDRILYKKLVVGQLVKFRNFYST
jgi:hypothetical protein